VKFLVVHNTYTEITGEDLLIQIFNASLREQGHFEVIEYCRDSKSFHGLPLLKKIRQLIQGNLPFYVPRDFRDLLERERPDIALIHNTIPLINPWILVTLKQRGIPVLASIYNYRLLCPRGTCVRNEKFCDLCYRWTPIWAVFFNCLGKYTYSLIYAYRYSLQRYLLKTITAFICSVKYRTELLQTYLPYHTVYFLTHYIGIDPALMASTAPRQNHILFAGRFVHDKGVRIVLECARRMPHIPFKLYGEGPLAGMCRHFIATHHLKNVELHPWAPHHENLKNLRDAKIFLFPSVYREFGRVLCEAMLLKTPVVVARNAVSLTIIRPHENGFLFDPNDITSLIDVLEKIWYDEPLLGRVAEQAHNEVRHYNNAHFCIRQVQDICTKVYQKKSTSIVH